MILYSIRNWDFLYENNRTRELKKLDWFPMPNKQDGDGYTLIMEQPDGAAIFGAWIVCVQIASRCDPRGTLMRDSATPHNAQSLARMSRVPAGILQRMLDVCSSDESNWLETREFNAKCDNPASKCDNPAVACASRARVPEGKEGKERREGNTPKPAVSVFSEMQKAMEEKQSNPNTNGELDPVFVRDLKAAYRRTPDSRMSHMEESTLAEIIRERPRYRTEWDMIITLKQKEPRYFPQSLSKLLIGWQDTLDRASVWVPEGKPVKSLIEKALDQIQ